jgi:hypothetical protein
MELHNPQAPGHLPYVALEHPASAVAAFQLWIAKTEEFQCSIHLAYWSEECSCTAPMLVTFQFHLFSLASHLGVYLSLASSIPQSDFSQHQWIPATIPTGT